MSSPNTAEIRKQLTFLEANRASLNDWGRDFVRDMLGKIDRIVPTPTQIAKIDSLVAQVSGTAKPPTSSTGTAKTVPLDPQHPVGTILRYGKIHAVKETEEGWRIMVKDLPMGPLLPLTAARTVLYWYSGEQYKFEFSQPKQETQHGKE